ncbi:MAG: hypothetical protein M3Z25_23890 [Actinomycetota bacterium]|nr:hypothetical protein [Actinomycetota bacterium]
MNAHLLTLLTGGCDPNPPPPAPPGIDALADQLISWLKWAVLTAGTVGILVEAFAGLVTP